MKPKIELYKNGIIEASIIIRHIIKYEIFIFFII